VRCLASIYILDDRGSDASPTKVLICFVGLLGSELVWVFIIV
jgi:hypothetical protein